MLQESLQPLCKDKFYNVAKMENFGVRLREHRERKNLTLKDVAERAQVSFSYVSTLERTQPHSITGKKIVPTRENVLALAKAVGWDTDEALIEAGYVPSNHYVNGFKIELPDDVEMVIPFTQINNEEDAEEFRQAFLVAYTLTKERLARDREKHG